MNDEEAKRTIIECLDKLYKSPDQGGDGELFEDGVRCERCLAFRFAHHLQNYLKSVEQTKEYYVDCDYDAMSNEAGDRSPIKTLIYQDGSEHNSYVDVIVHRRKLDSSPARNGWFCIEFKKWDNKKKIEWENDKQKLVDLTTRFDYQIGFHVVFAEKRCDVKWKIFKSGDIGDFVEVPSNHN